MTKNREVKVEYWDNGNTKFIEHYMYGTLNGSRVIYYEDGTKEFEQTWTDGQPNGYFYAWNETGELIMEKLCDENWEGEMGFD
jgi:antitoxin component YwqK of YwqJK toxin-antitoxin module